MMDTLLKKYAERIDEISCTGKIAYGGGPIVIWKIENLLLQFLLEYVELRENKKEKRWK